MLKSQDMQQVFQLCCCVVITVGNCRSQMQACSTHLDAANIPLPPEDAELTESCLPKLAIFRCQQHSAVAGCEQQCGCTPC